MPQPAEQTPCLALPYLAAGQAQKHVTLNESLRRLDALVQLSVRSRQLASPPAVPTSGMRYLVAAGATAGWAGLEGRIVSWDDGGWLVLTANPGWLLWVEDEARLLAFTSSGWVPAHGPLQNLPMLGIGTQADAGNRLAVRGGATLLTHEGGGHQLKLNKAAPGQTASLLFQTNWGGRAEIGTAGNDSLSVKLSADGSSWLTALVVLPDGRIGAGGVTSPAAGLDVAGSVRPGQRLKAALPGAAAHGAGALFYVPDATGGPVLAVSDGSTWRRLALGTVVS